MIKIIIVLIGLVFLFTEGQTKDKINLKKLVRSYQYLSVNYCPLENIEQWNCSTCKEIGKMKDIFSFTKSLKNRYFGGYSQQYDEIIISLRGSGNFVLGSRGEIALVKLDDCRKCEVQKKYVDLFNSVSVNLIKDSQILLKKYPSAKVVFVGEYSSCGIVALTALKMKNDLNNRIVNLYLFGLEKLGNRYFVDQMNDLLYKIFRVVGENTVEHCVPLQIKSYYKKWFHFGSEILITNNTRPYAYKETKLAINDNEICIDYAKHMDPYTFPKYFDFNENRC